MQQYSENMQRENSPVLMPPHRLRSMNGRDSVRTVAAAICLFSVTLPLQGRQPELQTGLIPEGTWVYRVAAGGGQAGELTSVIRRENGRIVSTSDMRGPQIQRGSLTAHSGTLTPIESSTFIYRPGEGSTSARLTYDVEGDSLFVSGSVVWSGVGQPGTTPMMIRQHLPREGWFDNQSVDLLICALPLEEGGTWSANLFDPTHDRPVRITISVVGSAAVGTPAGSFEAWNVTVEGMTERVEYMIERTTRVLVAQYIPGQNLRLELKSPLRPGL